MTTALTTTDKAQAIERVVLQGDLSKLSPEERISYHKMVCDSIGLNPLTKPFEYITLNGKLTLYAKKDATDQLRNIYSVSITIQAREMTEGVYVVTARATLPSGRTDESIGAVPIENLKGESRANAMMKAETKAKRRATLSICGLGMLDETEIETIPSAKPPVERTKEPIPVKQPVNRGREPGEDSDEDESAAATIAPPCIGLGQQANLAKAFRDALRAELKPDAEKLRHDWLGSRFYIDKQGNPSSTVIPATEWPAVRDAAVKYAKEL